MPIFQNIKTLKVILYFDILESKNYCLLFDKQKKIYNTKEKELAYNHWLKLNDYIFKLKSSQELQSDLTLNQESDVLAARVLTLKAIYNSFTMLNLNYNFVENYAEKRIKLIEIYNIIMFKLVEFNGLVDDLEFIKAIEISIQNLEYLIKRLSNKKIKQETTTESIYTRIAHIAVILNMQLSLKDMTITEYIEFEKIANEKAKKWKKTMS